MWEQLGGWWSPWVAFLANGCDSWWARLKDGLVEKGLWLVRGQQVWSSLGVLSSLWGFQDLSISVSNLSWRPWRSVAWGLSQTDLGGN